MPGPVAEDLDDRLEPVESDLALLHGGVPVDDERDRVVEGLDGEVFLAPEVVVDPALLDPGGFDELAHRGAGVPPLVEDGGGPLEDQAAGGLPLAEPWSGGAHASLSKTDRSVSL